MARLDLPVLEIWACPRPSCGAHNVAADSHCCVCEAPKEGQRPRPRPYERILPAVDLEEFLRDNFTRGAKRHQAEVHILNNRVYLTLTPLHVQAFDPAIYHVDLNAAEPCDSLGRRGW